MASPFLPSTPKAASTAAPPAVGISTPGKWRHPQLSEIVRRQNAATFSDKNLRKLVWNAGALMVTWAFGGGFKSYVTRIINSSFYVDLSVWLLEFVLCINILLALYPLYRPTDDLSDIPLTPTQRALLGLDPTATPPATPGSTYVTPPRYRMSSRKASPASASPLSATPFSDRRSSGAAFSPVTSPLFHKAVANGGRDGGRRQSFSQSFGDSFGSSSPLRRSSFGESTLAPSTPSPMNNKRSSLGVSNKWLYERSRRLSASNGSGVL